MVGNNVKLRKGTPPLPCAPFHTTATPQALIDCSGLKVLVEPFPSTAPKGEEARRKGKAGHQEGFLTPGWEQCCGV